MTTELRDLKQKSERLLQERPEVRHRDLTEDKRKICVIRTLCSDLPEATSESGRDQVGAMHALLASGRGAKDLHSGV